MCVTGVQTCALPISEGGSAGGEIVAEGTPEQVAEVSGSFTGQYLKPLLEKDKILQEKEQNK